MQGDSLLTPMVLPSLPTQPSEVKGRGRGDKMVTTPFLMACCREVAASLVGSAVLPSRQSLETKPVGPAPVSCAPRAQRSTPSHISLPRRSPHAPRVTAPASTLTTGKTRTHDRTLNVRDLTRRLHAPAHARPTRPHTAPRRCGGCGYEAASPCRKANPARGARPQDTLRPSKAGGHRPRPAPAQAQAAPKQETEWQAQLG